jgi:hypothetical protein
MLSTKDESAERNRLTISYFLFSSQQQQGVVIFRKTTKYAAAFALSLSAAASPGLCCDS